MSTYKIIVSPSTQKQIADTARYIQDELGPPHAANAFLDSIEDKFSVLASFPNAYPVDREASYLCEHEIRSAHLRSHRLLYQVDASRHEVHILSPRFSRENPAALQADDLQA